MDNLRKLDALGTINLRPVSEERLMGSLDNTAVGIFSGTLHDFNITGTLQTKANPNPRIEITSSNIAGYSDATTRQFYLDAATGKAFVGGGLIRLEGTGIYLRSNAVDDALDPGQSYANSKIKFIRLDASVLGTLSGSYTSGMLIYQSGVLIQGPSNGFLLTGQYKVVLGGVLTAMRDGLLVSGDSTLGGTVYVHNAGLNVGNPTDAGVGQIKTQNDIYCGTAGAWVSAIKTAADNAAAYLNQAVKTTSSPSFTKVTAGNGTYGVTCIRGEGSITAQDIGVDGGHQFWSGAYPGIERSLYFYAPEHMGINFCDTITVRGGIVTAYHEVDGTP